LGGEISFFMKTTKRKRASTAAKAEPGIETSAAAPVAVAAVSDEPSQQPAVAVETVVAEAIVDSKPLGPAIIVLAANCSVKDAAALKISLCAVANDSAPVTVDASATERVDTATMQLLCAFVRDRSGRNQSVTWRGDSPALQDAARLLGVRALLGFDAKGVAA
jgi:ABC-type transporter Mla MlaB component